MAFYPVAGDTQAQPGEAGGRFLTGFQVSHFSLFKLKRAAEKGNDDLNPWHQTNCHNLSAMSHAMPGIYYAKPFSPVDRWIPGGEAQGGCLMAALGSLGSVHNSPGPRQMNHISSDSDHPEPTYLQPALRVKKKTCFSQHNVTNACGKMWHSLNKSRAIIIPQDT